MSKIADLGRIITGKTPSTKVEGNWGNDIPFYAPEDIAKGYILDDAIRHISNQGFKTIKNNTTEGISVLVGCIGSDMGNAAIVEKKCAFNQQINAITDFNKNVNPFYVYYFLSTRKDYLRQLAGSTATPLLPKSDFEQIDVLLPNKPVQDNIVGILLPIDEKIKNNNAICSNLEAMAKLLYDYWFVQFDFPDEGGRPYKSSGGKMVWNEELKREIPENWEAKHLYDLAIFSDDRTAASSLTSSNYIGTDNLLPNMKGRVSSEYTPTEGNAVGFRAGDILLSNIRPYFKKIWISDIDGGCSADVLVIRSMSGDDKLFIYSSLARDDFFAYDMAGSKGSKMPRGDKNHIMGYPIPYNIECVKRFEQIVNIWFCKLAEIYHENQQLASLRDFLLPMLMNGQVKVGEVDA